MRRYTDTRQVLCVSFIVEEDLVVGEAQIHLDNRLHGDLDLGEGLGLTVQPKAGGVNICQLWEKGSF